MKIAVVYGSLTGNTERLARGYSIELALNTKNPYLI